MFATWFDRCLDPAFAAYRLTRRIAQASGLAAALLTTMWTSLASATAFVWNNGSGGSWTIPTNWTPNGDPSSAADTVSLGDISGPYTTTLSSNRTIGGLTMSGTNPTLDVSSTLTLSGGSSSISGSAALTGAGTILLQSGAALNWSSSSAPGGSLNFLLRPGQTASINNAGGGFAIGSGQKLNVLGPASTVLTTLTFNAGFSNDGVIQLGSIPPGDNYSNVRLILSSGTLTNNAAGAINLYPRSSTIYSTSERYIQANVVNSGTITSYTTEGQIGTTGATVSNAGTINLDSSIVSGGGSTARLTILGNSFTNTGTVNINDGRFVIGTNTYNYNAGTYNITGGTLAFGSTGGSTTVGWNSPDLTANMTFEVTPGADVTINRSTAWTLPANQTLLFSVLPTTIAQSLTLNQNFNNNGTVVMGRGTGDAYATQFFDIPTGTFTNNASGTVTMYPRSASILTLGTRAIRTNVQNDGLITSLSNDGQLGTAGKTVVNNGTLTLDNSILSAGSGRPQITVFGNSFTNTSSGTININDGRFVVATDTYTYGPGTYNINGGVFALGRNGGTTAVTWNGADFTDDMTFEINSGAQVNINRTTAWNILSNQSLDFSVAPSTNTHRLTLNQDLNNSGNIIMGRGTGDAYASQFLTLTSGTFTNNASGVVTMYPRSASILNLGNRAIEGNVVNNGTINVLTYDGRLGGAGKTVVNNGGLTLDNSILSAGSGVVKMIVTGNSFTNGSTGLIEGKGTLDVLGTTFNNAGTLSPGLSAGTLTVAGNVNFLSGGKLFIEVTGENAVAGVDYDQLIVTGSVTGLTQADLVVDISSVDLDLVGDVLTIVTSTSDFTGLQFNSVTFMGSGQFTGDVIYGNGFIQLANIVSFVPEPSSGFLLLAGLVAFRQGKRQHRKQSAK